MRQAGAAAGSTRAPRTARRAHGIPHHINRIVRHRSTARHGMAAARQASQHGRHHARQCININNRHHRRNHHQHRNAAATSAYRWHVVVSASRGINNEYRSSSSSATGHRQRHQHHHVPQQQQQQIPVYQVTIPQQQHHHHGTRAAKGRNSIIGRNVKGKRAGSKAVRGQQHRGRQQQQACGMRIGHRTCTTRVQRECTSTRVRAKDHRHHHHERTTPQRRRHRAPECTRVR